MKKISRMAMVTLIFAGLLGCYGWCEPPGDKAYDGKGSEKHMENMVKELNLTPEQEALIKDHRTEQGKKSREMRKEIQEKMDILRDELDKDTVDQRRIDVLVAELKVLEGKKVDHRIAGILNMRSVLKPEQFRKLKELRKKDEKKTKKRMKKMHSRSPREE